MPSTISQPDIVSLGRSNEALARRESILSVVAFAAERFLQDSKWEESIGEVLLRLGEATSVNRSQLFKNTEASLVLARSILGMNLGDGHPEDEGWPLPSEGWADSLREGEPIFGTPEQFPQAERAFLLTLEISSLALIPILIRGKWWGFLALVDNRSPRSWHEGELDALQALARIIGAAIARQQSDAELKRRAEESSRHLAATSSELESFCYSVSHDLRAPLRSISGFAQILLADHLPKLDADGRECLDRIVGASKRMGDLIDAQLALSRLSQASFEETEVNISVIVRGIGRELGRRPDTVPRVLEVDESIIVRGDRRLVEMAVRNLLQNAWKFTSRVEAPQVQVTGVKRAGLVDITVSDNGAGFDMEYVDRLFRPFERLHRQVLYPGVGIGLAIVARIAERHGGFVRAFSKGEGQGAAFTITLPCNS